MGSSQDFNRVKEVFDVRCIPNRGPSVGITTPEIAIMAQMILATLGANPCVAQGFGHGMPTPPPTMPHFSPAPPMHHFTAPPRGLRHPFRLPHSSGGPSQKPMRRSIQNGINQGLRNDITLRHMRRNKMDTNQRVRTNNHVERTNRTIRMLEKARYNWRRRRRGFGSRRCDSM